MDKYQSYVVDILCVGLLKNCRHFTSSECPGNGEFYFPDLQNKCRFWQCNKFGQIFNMPCAGGLIWDQEDMDCIRPPNGVYECGGECDSI